MKVALHPKRKGIRIEMLPLIDIVFLLLVFFIYAMLSMAVHRGLPVILPTSETAEKETPLLLSVTIKADGDIYVDREPTDLANLTAMLQNKGGNTKETGVLIFADRSTPYQTLYHVLDKIRIAGFQRISLQAEAASD